MADVRPFRALRYDAARIDPAAAIAPPYDVISPAQQAALYGRSPANIVRVEYGEQRPGDTSADNRYTRAAADLRAWRASGILMVDDAPALYAYRQRFSWEGADYTRTAWFAAVRLEPWERGIIKPHEHTLSGPKADRLDLLRATCTQVSPVYSVFRPKRAGESPPQLAGEPLYDFEADGQRHTVSAIRDDRAVASFAAYLSACGVYIADGHHRYETALTYRDERRAAAPQWTGDEPENFVLMALTDAGDPGLLVLPTHRIARPASRPADAAAALRRAFDIEDLTAGGAEGLMAALHAAPTGATVFGVAGLEPGRLHLATLRDRDAFEALMPEAQPPSWKRLDVSVLQYGVLGAVFGIDDEAVRAGALTYEQDPAAVVAAAAGGDAVGFVLNATRVSQVLDVADDNGRMPQKSTYFYPKLPTGLVLRPFDE